MGVSSKYPDSLKGFQEITDGRKKQLARIASIRKRSSILTIADQIDNLPGNEVEVILETPTGKACAVSLTDYIII